jgi:cyclic dehypoxanthinyl futalosine synthase
MDPALRRAADRVLAGERLDRADATALWHHADDALLQRLATHTRARFHPPDRATYVVMAIVNYTNVCVARCDYCAFYKFPGEAGTYVLSFEDLVKRIDAVAAIGGQLIGFNGGFHPDLGVDDYCTLFRRLHEHYGDRLAFYEMTIAEFMFVSKRSRLSYAESAARFKEAGTRWITGGGAEILDDAFRLRHSPGKYKVEDYYDAQRAVLDAGFGSTGTMVIGFDESFEERLNHLDRLRAFQDERIASGGGTLSSLLCWTYKPWNTELGGQELSIGEYLRHLALCRLYVDNIVNLRTSVLTRNEGALLGLAYGANDFDLPTEDEVTQKAGATISLEFEAVLDAARRGGFEPVRRQPWPIGGGALRV